MANFIEKLIDHELPTNGFKPTFLPKELLRSQRGLQVSEAKLKPTVRGFYQRDWVHGGTSQDNEKAYFVELTDRFKLGKFVLKPQFVFQSGDKARYTASAGLDLGNLGEVEVTHHAKNAKVSGLTEVSHYYSTHNANDLKNGLNSKATVSFQDLNSKANLRLSSTYTQTLDVLDRKTNKLNSKTTLYGVDTCLAFYPLQQTSYSLYYQSKTAKCDFIGAFLRKSTDEKYFSNKFVAGLKYKTAENQKLVAKASYNVEDRHPQLDLMLRNTDAADPKLKTYHKISTDLKAGSGFTYASEKAKINGLAQVNFRNNDSNQQPFSLSFKIEINETGEQIKQIPETKTVSIDTKKSKKWF